MTSGPDTNTTPTGQLKDGKMDTRTIMAMASWIIDYAYPSVWVKPLLGSVDDGFVSWRVSASGRRILDVRFMSESKRLWQYGSMFEINPWGDACDNHMPEFIEP